jgi:hypothetical protein
MKDKKIVQKAVIIKKNSGFWLFYKNILNKMIQRIQTLWLAIVVGLAIASFFFPVAIFSFDIKVVHTGMVYGFMPEKAGADMT